MTTTTTTKAKKTNKTKPIPHEKKKGMMMQCSEGNKNRNKNQKGCKSRKGNKLDRWSELGSIPARSRVFTPQQRCCYVDREASEDAITKKKNERPLLKRETKSRRIRNQTKTANGRIGSQALASSPLPPPPVSSTP